MKRLLESACRWLRIAAAITVALLFAQTSVDAGIGRELKAALSDSQIVHSDGTRDLVEGHGAHHSDGHNAPDRDSDRDRNDDRDGDDDRNRDRDGDDDRDRDDHHGVHDDDDHHDHDDDHHDHHHRHDDDN